MFRKSTGLAICPWNFQGPISRPIFRRVCETLLNFAVLIKYSIMEKRKKLYDIREISCKTGLSKATIRQDVKKMSHYRFGGNERIMMSDEQIEELLWARTRLVVPEL